MSLPINLLIEKNRLDTKYPWLLLLKIELDEPGFTTILLVRDFQDIPLFKGEGPYLNFNFSIGLINQSAKGGIPTSSLAVCNVTQFLQPFLEEFDGLVDASITITIIHANYLDEDYSELELNFDVLSSRITAEAVIIEIGSPSPLRQRFPLPRYFADLCSFRFKGPKCLYAGSDLTCNRRLSDCRLKETGLE